MAASAYKKFEDAIVSISPEMQQLEVPYVVVDAAEVDDAVAALLSDSASEEGLLVRGAINGLKRMTATTWEASVSYVPFIGGLPDPSGVDFNGRDRSYQFETGGGKRKVYANLATVAIVGEVGSSPDGWPDIAGMINATDDGVEGVEIESSVFRFSITTTCAESELPSGYKQRVFELTDCQNSLPITLIGIDFKPGEVLYLGMTGAQSDQDGQFKCTHQFAARKTVSGEVVPGLQHFEKRGWDYLETKTKLVTKGTPKVNVRVPAYAFVHRVFEEADLNALGVH